MARTAPAPNVPAPPGMCPAVATLAGGGDGGGSGGKGGNGGGGGGSGGDGSGDGAAGDEKGGGCAEGDPICPITGRMFVTIFDFGFAGPMGLRWVRHYDSRGSDRRGELGFGWSHSFGWSLEARRRDVRVFDDRARVQVFAAIPSSSEPVTNALGWALLRDGDGFSLRIQREGTIYLFGPDVGRGRHMLTAVLDRNGNRITVQRDEAGVLVGLVDSAGRPYRVKTDDRGRILEVWVATEETHQQWMRVAAYAYDDDGNLARAVDAEDFEASYAYDRHLMVEHRSVSGLSYFYRYDGRTARAYCVETWGEYAGRVDAALEHPIPPRPDTGPDRRKVKGIHYAKLTYLKDERYSEVENGLGGVTRYFGDEQARAIKIVSPSGGVTTRAYDPGTGGLLSEVTETGAARQAAPDANGNTSAFVDSTGKGGVKFIDEDGSEVHFDERDGSMVTRRHDSRGNLTFVEHPDGTTEEYTFDERGLMTTAVDRRGSRTTYHHDERGDCVCVETLGNVEVSEFDYLGRRVAHTDGSGRRTEWGWDRRNECVLKRHADGSEIRIGRDANRNPIWIDDAGRLSRYEWGGMAWITRVTLPDGNVTDYRYDVEGNLTWVRNARGQVFRQTFDQASRPIAVTTFEGLEHQAAYDVADNPLWMASPAGRSTFAHDLDEKLVAVETPDGNAIAIEHLVGGVRVDNGVVVLEEERDAVGQIVRDRQGKHESRIAWSGGAVHAVVSDVGPAVTYARSQRGDPSGVAAGRTAVGLSRPAGGAQLTFLGDHLVLRREFGPTGLLMRQALARVDPSVPPDAAGTAADPGVLRSSSYEYDARQMLRSEQHGDGRTVEYDLSAGDQVIARRTLRGGRLVEEERIAYDPAGTPVMAGAQYDAAMRPVALRGETFEYDAAGRLASRLTDAGVWRYEWSGIGDLVRVIAPDHVVEMDYDGYGRRIAKRVVRSRELVSSTTYVWSNNVVLHEVDDLDGSTRTYLRPDGEWEPIGHVDVRGGVETSCFYVHDPIGAIDCAVDERGQPVWEATRTVYGDYQPTREAVSISVRLANQHHDPDVGLVYNRRRWYDPRLGVFVSPDPGLIENTLNPRDYVRNPLAYIDPLGLFPAKKHPGHTGNPPPNPNGHAPNPGMPSKKDFGPDGKYLLKPGHNATEGAMVNGKWVPGYAVAEGDVRTASKSFPADVQKKVDAAGKQFGCHSCGAKKSGYSRKDHWTADHQAPASQIRAAEDGKKAGSAGEVRLYPHCKKCSNAQMRQAGSATDSERKKNAKEVAKNHKQHKHQKNK